MASRVIAVLSENGTSEMYHFSWESVYRNDSSWSFINALNVLGPVTF